MFFWPTARQRACHKIVADVGSLVVNAIQQGALRRRREKLLPLPKGDVSFFLRKFATSTTRYRVTIFEIQFNPLH